MIPVRLQPEPAEFDQKVRQPGYKWLADHDIDPAGEPPSPSLLPAYWQKTTEKLWVAYSGVCAYLAIYFEFPSGAGSTDHFIAKSSRAGDAYEWSNYRLACLGANRNKNKFDDVLDPFMIKPETFELNLVNGQIQPGSLLGADELQAAQKTIDRLHLDSAQHRRMRQNAFARYLRRKDEETLKELSPFVWHEANRQGLL